MAARYRWTQNGATFTSSLTGSDAFTAAHKRDPSLGRLDAYSARLAELGGPAAYYASCADCEARGGFPVTGHVFNPETGEMTSQTYERIAEGYCPHAGANRHGKAKRGGLRPSAARKALYGHTCGGVSWTPCPKCPPAPPASATSRITALIDRKSALTADLAAAEAELVSTIARAIDAGEIRGARVARILGVSRQRVHQLLTVHRREGVPA